jgi:hypothetical protein
MNVKDANEEIYKSLQSKNDILRMEAQIALGASESMIKILLNGSIFRYVLFQCGNK